MRRSIASVVLGVAMGCAAHVQAANNGPLFPEPLHLVRELSSDPAEPAVTIDEYCAGDRIVRVQGSNVTVIDYATREVRELDRSAGTFSVASFEELARARAEVARSFPAPSGESKIETTRVGSDRVRIQDEHLSIELRLDDAITLSRDAFDALLGAAYPNTPRPEHQFIATASRVERGGRFTPVADTAGDRLRLPIEQTIEAHAPGEQIRITTRIVKIAREPIPAELLLLPAGARQVEAHAIRFARELQGLDRVTVPLP